MLGELEILGREVTVVGQILLLMVLESSGKRKITWRASEEGEKNFSFYLGCGFFLQGGTFIFWGGILWREKKETEKGGFEL